MSDDSAVKMKNLTTDEFCRKFGACKEGAKFARRFKTMRECYDALLRGEAGSSSVSWAIWVATRKGVMPDRNLRLFAVRCARRVQHLMTDERSIHALDVAERYAKGDATAEELAAANAAAVEVVLERAAWAAADAAEMNAANAAADAAEMNAANAAADAANAAAWTAAANAAWTAAANAAADAAAKEAANAAAGSARRAAWAPAWSALAAEMAAREAEREAQLQILTEIGNPFEEAAE